MFSEACAFTRHPTVLASLSTINKSNWNESTSNDVENVPASIPFKRTQNKTTTDQDDDGCGGRQRIEVGLDDYYTWRQVDGTKCYHRCSIVATHNFFSPPSRLWYRLFPFVYVQCSIFLLSVGSLRVLSSAQLIRRYRLYRVYSFLRHTRLNRIYVFRPQNQCTFMLGPIPLHILHRSIFVNVFIRVWRDWWWTN